MSGLCEGGNEHPESSACASACFVQFRPGDARISRLLSGLCNLNRPLHVSFATRTALLCGRAVTNGIDNMNMHGDSQKLDFKPSGRTVVRGIAVST
ncbi:hypothetical protein ANN_19985 [Periplaneta americana]|uniref:Uncharacterized protein n=1 Tax=Periplaneta americana TaxID=6978 RepID=A0ABQ8SBM8_PERAM|nr:hypothetical protein ANN_19985 [Periplaneta americana]